MICLFRQIGIFDKVSLESRVLSLGLLIFGGKKRWNVWNVWNAWNAWNVWNTWDSHLNGKLKMESGKLGL